jgi:predicted DNA-binding protein YlxM (UPF0122 family)
MKIDEGKCIYVLFNSITNYTKIGVTDNIEFRIKTLENGCGCPLELIYTTRHLVCAEKYEIDIHAELSVYRKLGEWFELPTPNFAVPIIENITKEATGDWVVDNYKKGMPISKIAQEYEVTRQAILARLKKYGVYDSKGQIYEHNPNVVRTVIPAKTLPKNNESQHISTIDDSFDDTVYLDGEIPKLPLTNLKRVEPNINSNKEWYQISIFKDGEFIYAYTRDINKARAYVQGVRAADYTYSVNNKSYTPEPK